MEFGKNQVSRKIAVWRLTARRHHLSQLFSKLYRRYFPLPWGSLGIYLRDISPHHGAHWAYTQIERETPRKLDIHIVLDNYGSHKHPKVMAWLEKHPRFHLHFTPTSASWLNLVERFFRDVHMDVVKHGSFTHLSELNDALQAYMEERNSSPKRYVWRADGHKILEKINRARQVLKERQQHDII